MGPHGQASLFGDILKDDLTAFDKPACGNRALFRVQNWSEDTACRRSALLLLQLGGCISAVKRRLRSGLRLSLGKHRTSCDPQTQLSENETAESQTTPKIVQQATSRAGELPQCNILIGSLDECPPLIDGDHPSPSVGDPGPVRRTRTQFFAACPLVLSISSIPVFASKHFSKTRHPIDFRGLCGVTRDRHSNP